MMTHIRSCLSMFSATLFVAAFVVFVETQSLFAQGGSGYLNFGNTPSISPWLGLTNRPTGSLDPYNQYVRPQLEMQRTLGLQQSQINQQAVQQQEMLRRSNLGAGGQLHKLGESQMGTIRVTGRASQAATFRNYSHYYPNFNKRF